MHFRVVRGIFCQSACLFLAAALCGVAQAQPAELAVEGVLQQGRLLEVERRWGEALTHYENALREHPDDASIRDRMNTARVHYDLGRRYNDQSFLDSLRSISRQQVFQTFSEVTSKIESHYVNSPDWNELMTQGVDALLESFKDPAFVAAHKLNISPERLENVSQLILHELAIGPVQSRADAVNAAGRICDLTRRELGLGSAAIVYELMCGATGSLDPYCTYLTGNQLDELYSQIDGNFVGLGVELKAVDGQLTLVDVINHSPAERAGLTVGDIILGVDGKLAETMSSDEAADMLQGIEGSVVELLLLSPEQTKRTVSIRRETVDIPSVDRVKIVDSELGIGYLRLNCFQKTTARDLDEALWQLSRQKAKSLIIDLRGNPGGLLHAAVEAADRFLKRGVIVSTRGRAADEDSSYSAHEVGTWGMPLVVLIDGDSASASEIFAGAIRDHRRGAIVGTRSYGKGSVQGIFSLNSINGGVRLTTSKFYSPNNLPFSGIGVEPDYLVHEAARADLEGTSANSASKDAVLDAALRLARRGKTSP